MSGYRLELDRWDIIDVDPGAGMPQDGDWITVQAPADTYQALIRAGRLAHPFEARNEAAAAWVRDREWWWRTLIEAPAGWAADEDIELVFEGLDTFATVFLEGQELGRTDNMFRRYAFDLRGRVRPGEWHSLAIRFDPTALADLGPAIPPWGGFVDRISRSRRNLMRKAQFGWGWDWGPDLPTVGVWQPARIEVRPKARLADTRFVTLEASAQRASAELHLAYDHLPPLARIDFTLTDPQGAVAFHHAGPTVPLVTMSLDRPQLWWTADLGDQPLYGLTVRLFDGDRLVDEARQTVGLRTIALDQSPDPDEPGTTFFRFLLNGAPIFAKGACWVPSTSFVAEPDPAAYERLITRSVAANMNMLRIWGGGIYEPDLFYDLCDRHGLLVWQDFMFACAPYPDEGAFAASVAAEVADQVRRLRHHPCLALWCGNNENQAIHRIAVDLKGEDPRLAGAALYDQLFPELLGRLDPATPYWPGSPEGGPHPNSMKAGDVHDWTVWHGLPPIPDDVMIGEYVATPQTAAYSRYAEDMGRFISEFGIQAAPAMATLERWMDAGDLALDTEGFLERIKDEANKAQNLMASVTGPPATLQDYVDFTQWTQAEGLKFGIEHFRRRRPHCSGALLWQLNDCWPCVSWSLIDYDGAEKAAFHAVRRAFAPVLASFKAEGETVELWISNDTAKAVEGEAIVTLESLDGRQRLRTTVAFSAPSGGHAVPWRGTIPPGDDLVLRVQSATGAFEPNRHLSAPIARLGLVPGARPTVAFSRIGPAELRVTLTAEVYLAFVHLTADRPDLTFSDNHFDLAAGEARTLTVTGHAAFGPGDLTVRSWNDRP